MSPAQAPVAPPRDAPTRDVPTRDVSVPSASDAGATAPARPATRPRPRAMIPGIGEPLPAGETLLWTGGPVSGEIARRVCHTRGVVWYFAALAALVLAGGATGGGIRTSAVAVLTLGAMALAVLGFSRVYAALVARTTVYAITDRRLVLRIGVAIPAVLNVPLEQIESVDLRAVRAGAGDVTVSLTGGARVAYLLLWPHARPWRYARPEPALRGIAEAADTGVVLADAVRARLAALAPAPADTIPAPRAEVA
jgi:hypothetical protein